MCFAERLPLIALKQRHQIDKDIKSSMEYKAIRGLLEDIELN